MGYKPDIRVIRPGKPIAAPAAARPGLGDIVARFAQPIARAIDRVAGTNFRNCGGCKKRQEWLNKKVPL